MEHPFTLFILFLAYKELAIPVNPLRTPLTHVIHVTQVELTYYFHFFLLDLHFLYEVWNVLHYFIQLLCYFPFAFEYFIEQVSSIIDLRCRKEGATVNLGLLKGELKV